MKKSMGLYTCFSSWPTPLVALLEERERIVLCDPGSLHRCLVYQLPTFHFGITFREFEFLDQHGKVLLLANNLAAVLGFAAIPQGRMGLACEELPVDFEAVKPSFLFGKDISVQSSLAKWEESLATNTLTDYEERVSQ